MRGNIAVAVCFYSVKSNVDGGVSCRMSGNSAVADGGNIGVFAFPHGIGNGSVVGGNCVVHAAAYLRAAAYSQVNFRKVLINAHGKRRVKRHGNTVAFAVGVRHDVYSACGKGFHRAVIGNYHFGFLLTFHRLGAVSNFGVGGVGGQNFRFYFQRSLFGNIYAPVSFPQNGNGRNGYIHQQFRGLHNGACRENQQQGYYKHKRNNFCFHVFHILHLSLPLCRSCLPNP